MKFYKFAFVLLLIAFISCEKKSDEDFAPTDVFVKIKGYYTIDKVFAFINTYHHKVENIQSQVYTSRFPSDSLQYVLDYLNNKPYINEGVWPVNGYLHYQTNVITIFPRLFNMEKKEFQIDWLESMESLELDEQTTGETAGCIIYFHIPEGTEIEWKNRFEQYDFVEWVELNSPAGISPN